MSVSVLCVTQSSLRPSLRKRNAFYFCFTQFTGKQHFSEFRPWSGWEIFVMRRLDYVSFLQDLCSEASNMERCFQSWGQGQDPGMSAADSKIE